MNGIPEETVDRLEIAELIVEELKEEYEDKEYQEYIKSWRKNA